MSPRHGILGLDVRPEQDSGQLEKGLTYGVPLVVLNHWWGWSVHGDCRLGVQTEVQDVGAGITLFRLFLP